MKNSIVFFDFSVDKEKKVIKVEREFLAPLTKVWDAWTKSEILDQWWAPKPYHTRTKSLDFREGGHWIYAMIGPDNTTQWCRADFKSVVRLKSFTGAEAFCDVNGNINTEFPVAFWTVKFRSDADSTMVSIELKYQNLEDLEKYIEMGFREGFTAALENLDDVLKL